MLAPDHCAVIAGAEVCGVDRDTIRRAFYERGVVQVRVGDLVAVCAVFGVTLTRTRMTLDDAIGDGGLFVVEALRRGDGHAFIVEDGAMRYEGTYTGPGSRRRVYRVE